MKHIGNGIPYKSIEDAAISSIGQKTIKPTMDSAAGQLTKRQMAK